MKSGVRLGSFKNLDSEELLSGEVTTPVVKDQPESSPKRKALQLKFDQKNTQPLNRPRQDVLALPKPDYRGKDLFQRPDFRGLVLSDYQVAIGERARESVELLNKTTVSQFP